MFDTGGDGWQGGWFGIHTLMKDKTWLNHTVANGTLINGSYGIAWLCLTNGCYELVVEGGDHESEILLTFVDEEGDSFSDMSPPFHDHLCVSDGDVMKHPTAGPTVPPPPTLRPSLSSTPSISMLPTSTVASSPSPD